MKILTAILFGLTLYSCGAEQAALTNSEALAKASDQAKCELSFVGQWQNDGDSSVFTVSDDNGVCKFSMSCGASGTIVALNGDYELQDQTNSQSCNFNSGFTINGKVKLVSIMLYQDKLLTSINNESSNQWTKIN